VRRYRLFALACLCIAAGSLDVKAENWSAPWMSKALSSDRRAELVLRRMTMDEKLQLVRGRLKPPHGREMAGYVPGVPRLGIPPLLEINGGIGVADAYEEAPAWEATPLPAEIAIAATWNPSLAYEGGAMVGTEARRRGFNVLLGGAVNLTRNPHNGRNFEYAGEDPLLAGTMVGEMVRGIQDQHVVSTLKHFAVANQETGRAVLDARISAPAMRESELLAFEIAMEHGDPGSMMCAYNRVNGVYACENDYLLSAVLRRDWTFRGWVMSDWGAVHSTVNAARAGLDQESAAEMDSQAYFGEPLRRAVMGGGVRLSRLRDMARRIVRTLFAKGVVDAPPDSMPIDAEADAAVARQIAEEGIVLLRNRSNQLPLSHNLRRIAVIGGHANDGVLSGGGSSQVIPFGGPAVALTWRNDDPLMLYKQVVYDPSPPLRAIAAQAPQAAIDYVDGQNPAEAARIAVGADVAIVFVVKWQTEGSDAKSLDLPDGQDQLVAAVAAANPNTIVVLETGNPVLMPWLDQVRAVVEAWYPGARGGDAIAAVLFGEVNPSGRLPITFPKSEDQLPRPRIVGDARPSRGGFAVTYAEGADVGYRWFAARDFAPLFPFGFGLSYTSFNYGRLTVAGGKTSFDVTNTGGRPGSEVAQVYANDPAADNGVRRRLIGWSKIVLQPGETRRISVTADPRLLASFDERARCWRIATGRYQVFVGASSADLRLVGAVPLFAHRMKP
jgi:beta-glucosidase